MKKKTIFKRLIISVLALSMVLSNFCTAFADEPKSDLAELVVSEIGYDAIGGMYEDTIVAKKDGKWGMVKFDGTVLVPFEYEEMYSFDQYDGVTVLRNIVGEFNGEYIYNYYAFDRNGKNVYEADGDTVGNRGFLSYYNGIYIHHYWNAPIDVLKTTYMDANGKVILKVDNWRSDEAEENVKYLYESTSLSSDGYAVYYPVPYSDNSDTSIYLVSKEGVKEIKTDRNGATPFFAIGDFIFCQKTEEVEEKVDENSSQILGYNVYTYALRISTGEILNINTELTEGYSWSSDTAYGVTGDKINIKYGDGTGCSLLDNTGKTITGKKYSSIEATSISKKYYLVSEGDKWFYIDLEGNEYATDLKDAGCFYDGKAIVLNADGQAYIVDEEFNQLTNSVTAEAVVSCNKNAYAIKVDGKMYPAYIKNATYTKELTNDAEVISSADFAAVLSENATKDVAITNADGVTFTFAKGTMSAVDGKTEYDFGTSLITDYSKATELSSAVNKDNFILQIDYNYSGNLPAQATITFNVGSELAGKTLYYYLYNTDKTYKLVQSVVVGDDGSISIKQDHCSTYVLTSAEIVSETPTEAPTETQADTSKETSAETKEPSLAEKTPNTGDSTMVWLFAIMSVVSISALAVSRKVKNA